MFRPPAVAGNATGDVPNLIFRQHSSTRTYALGDCTLFQPAGKKSQPEMVSLSVSESATKELEQSGRPVRLVVGKIAILAGADCASGRLRVWPIWVPCSSAQ